MEPGPTTLPEARRYILTHNSEGTSVVHSSPDQKYHVFPGMGGIARSYCLPTVPGDVSNDQDVKKYLSEDASAEPSSHAAPEIVARNKTGANILVVDLLPGGETHMHRTVSVDYSVCIIGNIDMELDSGEIVHLKPSDHVVQRGTMHKWINTSKTEPARFIAVTLPCESFDIGGGKQLEEVHVPPSSK